MEEDSRVKQDLSNVEVVVLAVYMLGGDQKPVDTEDIAMKANELAPGRFNWRKYPEQVDLEPVRKRLSDALKREHANLLAGGVTKGWRLTPSGLSWALQNVFRAKPEPGGRKRMDRELEQRRKNEEFRIRNLPAWTKFSVEENISMREAEAVFRVSEYVQGHRRQQLIDRARSLFIHDEKLSPFVEAMAKIVKMEGERL